MSLASPDKIERAWMTDVAEFGCIVCRLYRMVYSPCCVHHLLNGSKRISHLHTIGLCPLHHQGRECTDEYVARHPFHAEFEKRYGTEDFLLDANRQLILAKNKHLIIGYQLPSLPVLKSTQWRIP